MHIGLTGGIATGKSTVSRWMAERGALVIDADIIAREVVMPGSPVLEQVFERFGPEVRNPDGTLNRRALGQLVFADEAAREDLNGLLHPSIRQLMWSRLAEAEQAEPDRLAVVDIPLLFEGGLQSRLNETLLVYAEPEVQLRRLMARDGLDEQAARRRLDAQMPIGEKRRLADYVIDNSGDWAATERQLDALWRRKGWS